MTDFCLQHFVGTRLNSQASFRVDGALGRQTMEVQAEGLGCLCTVSFEALSSANSPLLGVDTVQYHMLSTIGMFCMFRVCAIP